MRVDLTDWRYNLFFFYYAFKIYVVALVICVLRVKSTALMEESEVCFGWLANISRVQLCCFSPRAGNISTVVQLI